MEPVAARLGGAEQAGVDQPFQDLSGLVEQRGGG
jgi:hypothetical protein